MVLCKSLVDPTSCFRKLCCMPTTLHPGLQVRLRQLWSSRGLRRELLHPVPLSPCIRDAFNVPRNTHIKQCARPKCASRFPGVQCFPVCCSFFGKTATLLQTVDGLGNLQKILLKVGPDGAG